MGYCSLDDLINLVGAEKLAGWIKTAVPDYISAEKLAEISAGLSVPDADFLRGAYAVDAESGDYRKKDLSRDERSRLASIFIMIEDQGVIESAIADAESDFDTAAASGGYSTPISETSPAYNTARKFCKLIACYQLLVAGGALELEGDKRFIEMCDKARDDLVRIAEGKLKLPGRATGSPAVISPGKITDWRGY